MNILTGYKLIQTTAMLLLLTHKPTQLHTSALKQRKQSDVYCNHRMHTSKEAVAHYIMPAIYENMLTSVPNKRDKHKNKDSILHFFFSYLFSFEGTVGMNVVRRSNEALL